MKEKILAWLEKWKNQGYKDGIPDEVDAKLEALGKVPSYRMVCKAILKNDVSLSSLGYSRQACDSYVILKRIELAARVKK